MAHLPGGNPVLSARVKAIRAALDEVSTALACYEAITDLVCPTHSAKDMHLVNRGSLTTLLGVINHKFAGELGHVEEEFRGLWTEVNP